MDDRAITLRPPWADLVMCGVKPVENRTRPVPSTLPSQTALCPACGERWRLWTGDACNGDPINGRVHVATRMILEPFPFRLWIHAAKTYDKAGNRAVMDWAHAVNDETHRRGEGPLVSPVKMMMNLGAPERRGALLGSVTVTSQHHADECHKPAAAFNDDLMRYDRPERWCHRFAEPDRWHIIFADPQPLATPIPCRGQQGWWRLPDAVKAALAEQDAA